MKINRFRKVNRTLKFYANHFGFRKPYQIIIDGTICVAALRNKINIQEQFKKYLGGDVKLLTTACIVKEVEKLGSKASGALFVLRNFGQHRCGHNDSSVPASDCILHMVKENNGSRYIIATQDRELQENCRGIAGVPLLYFHLRVPTLEAPSSLTVNKVSDKSEHHFRIKDYEREKLKHLTQSDNVEHVPSRKKRKIKGGPNPLSCKKKKKKPNENATPKNLMISKKKKKRNHKTC